jgi:hypothetical protein
VIYEYPDPAAPIRQGDIFAGLPRVEVSLGKIPILEQDGMVEREWRQIASEETAITAIFPLRPVTAIVATQDCDATHAQDITLCEIRPFREVYPAAAQTTKPKKWVNVITQHARVNLKWFYLPPDGRLGFSTRMAAEFMVTLRVPRVELEALRELRRGRLNDVADEHFRERIGEFYRRYPYDEWYPLDQEELGEYRSRYPNVQAFPWQRTGSDG